MAWLYFHRGVLLLSAVCIAISRAQNGEFIPNFHRFYRRFKLCIYFASDTIQWELKLYRDLMVSYDKNIRPVRNASSQLTARVLFSLARVESMVRVHMSLVSSSVRIFIFVLP